MFRSRLKSGALWGLGLALIMVGLNACTKPKPKPKADKPPATVAPLGYAMANTDASVTLTLPETIKIYPSLHTEIYSQGERDLRAFMLSAQKSHSELTQRGFAQPAFYKNIRWYIASQSTHLVSSYAEINTDEGGAHPNSEYQTILWDKKSKAPITNTEFFDPLVDITPLDAYLCITLESERTKRIGRRQNQGGNCPKIINGRIILIQSRLPDKLAAIDILYGPYEVGAYAEGPYFIRIPQNILKPFVNSIYRDDFEGEANMQVAQDIITTASPLAPAQ